MNFNRPTDFPTLNKILNQFDITRIASQTLQNNCDRIVAGVGLLFLGPDELSLHVLSRNGCLSIVKRYIGLHNIRQLAKLII